jgi:GH15 family glucan-1,4-alpha-glucosidase
VHSAIEDHAIIGDLHTVALVSTRGSIDFMCLPRIDGPSVFASLLDEQAGCFAVSLTDAERRYRQQYVPDTNVLVTRILSSDEVIEIVDFMVVGQKAHAPVIVRRIFALRGTPRITVHCRPAFDYGRVGHTVEAGDCGVNFTAQQGSATLALIGTVPVLVDGDAATAEFELEVGRSIDFVLGTRADGFPRSTQEVAAFADARHGEVLQFWRTWAARSTYKGRYREVVMRSALALKLLVSGEHGSIAAAATFGLPEASAGERNWDYRFTWIRDASFAVYAFIRLGYVEEALAFMHWISKCLDQQGEHGPLQPLYRMDGTCSLDELELTHFAGYGGAKPVRIGNAAAGQLQLDIYGAFMDAVYLTSKYGGALSIDGWKKGCKVIEWVCKNWRQPDEGIWEVRNGRQELLHSRLMCWVAVDRAVRLAQKRSLPAPLREWNQARSDIYDSIVTDFWNDDLNSFVRAVGTLEVDASTLMMPLVRFVSARDPKWRSTQLQIEKQLAEDGLVYRYRPGTEIDGMPGHEGAFTTCSFWLVECLARQGETGRAQLIFEKILDYGNHVNLFAEEIDSSGSQMGNFPQALTHLSLISSAFALDRALSGRSGEPWS